MFLPMSLQKKLWKSAKGELISFRSWCMGKPRNSVTMEKWEVHEKEAFSQKYIFIQQQFLPFK